MTGLARSGAIVALGTGLSRLTGLARISVIAYVVGFTRLTDGYNLANATPNILYELLLGGVLTATLVPIFVDHFERDDEEATSAVVSVAIAVLVAVAVVGILLAPLIAHLYTLRITDPDVASQREFVTSLLRWFMPQVLLYGIVALATAMLNARRRFAAPAFAPAFNNLVVIAVFLLLRRWAGGTPSLNDALGDRSLLVLLGLGTTAGVALMTFTIFPAVVRSGIRLRVNLDWRHPAIREILRLSGWTVGYVASNQLALWLVILLALERSGDLSAYQTAFVFFQLPHGLLAVSLMTTAGPELAARARDLPRLRTHFRDTLRLMIIAMTPAAVGYAVLARPIVEALLERGAFANASAVRTAEVLVLFAVALVPFSVYLYALRGFYALRDTRTPFRLNLLENGINVALAIALVPTLEVQGLAISYAIAYSVAAVAALVALSRRIGSVVDGPVMRSAALTAGCASVMAGVVWTFDRMITNDLTSPARALAGACIGVVVYGGLIAITQGSELLSLWRPDHRPVTP